MDVITFTRKDRWTFSAKNSPPFRYSIVAALDFGVLAVNYQVRQFVWFVPTGSRCTHKVKYMCLTKDVNQRDVRLLLE